MAYPTPDDSLDGPADGRSPNHRRNFVKGDRNETQRGNPSNPRMSAVPDESVEDLGHINR